MRLHIDVPFAAALRSESMLNGDKDCPHGSKGVTTSKIMLRKVIIKQF